MLVQSRFGDPSGAALRMTYMGLARQQGAITESWLIEKTFAGIGVIYNVKENSVCVFVVIDSRRNVKNLLLVGLIEEE